MNAIVMLDWKFSPPYYFEESIEISRQDYTMTITDGQVHAKIDSAMYETKSDMREGLHEALNNRFLGVQLLTHRAYELSRPRVTRVHPDGHRDIFVEIEEVLAVASVDYVDFRVTDKDGNVIADSKRDRVEKKKILAELIASYRAKDTLLASLLRSQTAAVHDPITNSCICTRFAMLSARSLKPTTPLKWRLVSVALSGLALEPSAMTSRCGKGDTVARLAEGSEMLPKAN
jgi:hypothetical protein